MGPRYEVLHESLARAVVGHEVHQLVAFRRRVFRMEPRIDVQPRAVRKEDIRILGARNDFLEQVPREDLDRNGPALCRCR